MKMSLRYSHFLGSSTVRIILYKETAFSVANVGTYTYDVKISVFFKELHIYTTFVG
jgi:hypothetical protein